MSSPPKPSQFRLDVAIRPNILALTPYRCARDDYDEGILLDANENALGHALPRPPNGASLDEGAFDDLSLHRYPSPSHLPVKKLIANLRKVPSTNQIFLGVGSDEVIDLLFRITCRPEHDRALVCPPTYGMYAVCAQINDVQVVKLNLDVEGGKFRPKVDEINKTISEAASGPNPIKLVFLCSPGNPTGTLIPLDDIRAILRNPDYTGLVVVDEAYIDFSPPGSSAINLLVQEGWKNLVVMQTLSKGFGLAAIRLGIAFSSPEIIQILNNIKAPYNISTPTATLALRALSPEGIKGLNTNIEILLRNRENLANSLLKLPGVIQILGQADANFLLTQIGNKRGEPDNEQAQRVYEKMAREEKVVVRFRGNEVGCLACLRITVGTEAECKEVIEKLSVLLEQD